MQRMTTVDNDHYKEVDHCIKQLYLDIAGYGLEGKVGIYPSRYTHRKVSALIPVWYRTYDCVVLCMHTGHTFTSTCSDPA